MTALGPSLAARRGTLAALAVLLLSLVLGWERGSAHGSSPGSRLVLAIQIASGPIHAVVEAVRERAAVLDLALPLLLGGIAVLLLWRGISRGRQVALAIGVLLWVFVGYTSAVLLWEI